MVKRQTDNKKVFSKSAQKVKRRNGRKSESLFSKEAGISDNFWSSEVCSIMSEERLWFWEMGQDIVIHQRLLDCAVTGDASMVPSPSNEGKPSAIRGEDFRAEKP